MKPYMDLGSSEWITMEVRAAYVSAFGAFPSWSIQTEEENGTGALPKEHTQILSSCLNFAREVFQNFLLSLGYCSFWVV